MVSAIILDGYIDEPTCLGVPPYISPYPRYIAGAIWTFDPNALITYHTIDQIRNDHTLIESFNKVDLLIVIAGMAVPGRYLCGYPVSPGELYRLLGPLRGPLKLLCGPAARFGFGMSGGKKTQYMNSDTMVFDALITGDPEIVITDILNKEDQIQDIDVSNKRKNALEISSFAVNGAQIIKQHPFFPDHLIAEIETYRGCPRSIIGGCSFCSEPSKGPPDFRMQKDIHHEIKTLYRLGLKHIRLGNQPCIFSYKAHDAAKKPVPRPNPNELMRLFKGIHTVAPDLKTIHIDNANPGVLSTYPEECRQIIDTIITYHTPGDVAALGIESADPQVIEENNLKVSAERALDAIRLFNETGKKRGNNGMPELLPGINLLFGLKGETKKTFQYNYDFLQRIRTEQLLIRRINIRQVIPIPGTPMDSISIRLVKKHHTDFQRFKRRIQTEIQQPLLQQIVPQGTLLTDVIAEKQVGNLTFGRQMGSYPLLVGIIGKHELEKPYTVKVFEYGFRSITAHRYPVYINHASRDILEALPGVGKKRALHILLNRPFNTKEEFISSFDDVIVAENILPYISFEGYH